MQATQHKKYTHLLAKDTHTHTTTHNASLIHLLVKNTRETQSKGEDRITALARSVAVTYKFESQYKAGIYRQNIAHGQNWPASEGVNAVKHRSYTYMTLITTHGMIGVGTPWNGHWQKSMQGAGWSLVGVTKSHYLHSYINNINSKRWFTIQSV